MSDPLVKDRGSVEGKIQIPGTVGEALLEDQVREVVSQTENPQAGCSPAQLKYERLCRAARDGEIDTVESLLAEKTPTDMPPSASPADKGKTSGMTPLLWASERGHTAAVKALIRADAMLLARDPYSMTPLHWAAARGHKDVIRLLVAAGAPLDSVEQDNMSPLHLAATQGQAAAVSALLELGADPDFEGKENWPPLLWAAQKGHPDVVRILCRASGEAVRHMQQALHIACDMGHGDVVAALIKLGAEVNKPGPDRMLPVHRATLRGRTQVVRVLLAHGATVVPFQKDKHNLNHTPLHWAAAKGNAEICEALLSAGQEVNAVDKRNWTALHWAVEKGHAGVVGLLLQSGADVNAVDKDNRAPLRFAAVQGFVGGLDALISHGAALDTADKTQMTALHWAAKRGRAEVVNRLVAAGANPLLRDKDGQTAQDVARQSSFPEIAEVLSQAEAAYAAANPGAELAAREAHRPASNSQQPAQSPDASEGTLQAPAVETASAGHRRDSAPRGAPKGTRRAESTTVGCLCFKFRS